MKYIPPAKLRTIGPQPETNLNQRHALPGQKHRDSLVMVVDSTTRNPVAPTPDGASPAMGSDIITEDVRIVRRQLRESQILMQQDKWNSLTDLHRSDMCRDVLTRTCLSE